MNFCDLYILNNGKITQGSRHFGKLKLCMVNTKCAMKVHQWFIKLIYFSSTRKLKIRGVKGAAYLPGDGSWNKHEETAGNTPDVGSGSSMPDLPPSSNFDHQPSTSNPRNLASSHPTSSNKNPPFSPLNASPSHTNSNSSPPNLSSHDSSFDTGKVFFD